MQLNHTRTGALPSSDVRTMQQLGPDVAMESCRALSPLSCLGSRAD